MLILMLVILVLVSVEFFIWGLGRRSMKSGVHLAQDVCLSLGCVFAILSVVVLIVIGVNLIKINTIPFLNQKIELYEKENEEHKKVLDEIVAKYLSRTENERYLDLRNEDSIIALSLISDFNVDTHTSWRLRSYQNNRNKILELREQIIEIEKMRKIYFFGL